MSIVRLFQRLVAWFMPAGLETDSLPAFRVQANVAVSLLVGNSGFPFMVLFFLMGLPREGSVVLWSWIFFMAIPFLAQRGVRPHTLAHLLSANYYQCHLGLCVLFGGIEAPNTMWFAATPIVSVLVGGITHGLIWAAIASATVMSIYALEVSALFSFPTGLDPGAHLLILAGGTVGLMAAILGSTASFELLRTSALRRRLQAEDELREANKDLRALDAQKTSFFQNISHELRTPLTLILPPLDEAARKRPEDVHMTMAARNARRLLRLVNQLLDLQKLRAGKRVLDLEPIEVMQFVKICGDSIRSACSTKELDFTVQVDTPVSQGAQPSIWIQADPDALEKIIFNFLSNALKFTPRGGRIEFGATTEEERVRFYVQDTGPGIAPEDLPQLFKVFSQVDSTTSRAFEGTGLGLALAKSLADELGGEVGVKSTVNVGSTFWFELPRSEAPPQSVSAEFIPRDWLIDPVVFSEETTSTEMAASGAADGALALVVDDLPDLRQLVTSFLMSHGCRTIQAPNGKRGLELAIARKPDIIITDWMMPVMTGVEFIEAIRNTPDIAGTPTVLLTAKSDEESRLIGTEIGADAFLGKPFSEQELVSVVRNLVALKAREREVVSLNQALTDTVLKRYLPPSLVDRIIDDDLALGTAEMRVVTVLFSDICNFTRTSEDLGPSNVAELLNAFLSKMTETIFEFEGTIDKFIGDGIMVVFGAPVRLAAPEQARRATACGLAMQRAMQEFAETCEARGLPRLQMRVGIHQGEAVVGNFGSSQRLDYTCIGPTVNNAARIETSCPPGRVMVSEAIRHHLESENLSEAGLFKLKGIQAEQRLFVMNANDGGGAE